MLITSIRQRRRQNNHATVMWRTGLLSPGEASVGAVWRVEAVRQFLRKSEVHVV